MAWESCEIVMSQTPFIACAKDFEGCWGDTFEGDEAYLMGGFSWIVEVDVFSGKRCLKFMAILK